MLTSNVSIQECENLQIRTIKQAKQELTTISYTSYFFPCIKHFLIQYHRGEHHMMRTKETGSYKSQLYSSHSYQKFCTNIYEVVFGVLQSSSCGTAIIGRKLQNIYFSDVIAHNSPAA